MSHWIYRGKLLEELPDDVFGFVYRITNTISGKKYIGRKYVTVTRRVKREGSKRRRVITKESNWREYIGSSNELIADIEKLGKDKFIFEILAFGYSKGQVNYLEEAVQYKYNVLFDDTYYNSSIGSRKYVNIAKDERFLNELFQLD
jgi:hypothetical protein